MNWFTDRISFFAIAATNVIYHGFPFIAITLLAGLMSVPRELYEAAEVDGASRWVQFRKITVPLLKPVFAVCTILSTIWDFKVFNQVYLMPGGDGANKDVYNLGVWSYIESFGQGAPLVSLLDWMLYLGLPYRASTANHESSSLAHDSSSLAHGAAD